MARTKGSENIYNKEIKEMIKCALHKAGGVDYLVEQANKSPTAFMSLIGKMLPLKVANEDDEQFKVQVTMNVIGKPTNT